MDSISLIGIDLGKHCFHLHAQSASSRMVFPKKLTRSQMFMLLANVVVRWSWKHVLARTGSPVAFKNSGITRS